jgi:hypothetical protein
MRDCFQSLFDIIDNHILRSICNNVHGSFDWLIILVITLHNTLGSLVSVLWIDITLMVYRMKFQWEVVSDIVHRLCGVEVLNCCLFGITYSSYVCWLTQVNFSISIDGSFFFLQPFV